MPKQDIIVCAVDGSEASKTATKWAANTAVKRGIPLRLVSSYSMPQFLYAEGMVPPQELYEDLEAETLEKIEEAKKVAVDFVPEVDVSHQIEVLDLLTDLNRARGTTIVMVLHDLNLAARYADQLVAVADGKLHAAGRPEDVLTEDTVRTVFGMDNMVITDPSSGKPLMLPLGRHHVGAGAAAAAVFRD